MAIQILGIRHHGVGSARNVLRQLEQFKPDMLLVEGAPEMTEVLSLVGKEGLTPPVAIMVYNQENPKQSSFYPFAEYSPEWTAVRYANQNKIPVRAMDLPAAVSFVKRDAEEAAKEIPGEDEAALQEAPIPVYHRDPLSHLSEAAGFRNSDDWWDHHFESTLTNTDHFEAVHHAMDSLRAEGVVSGLDRENIDREAYMRTIIRQAQNEMYERIAVVCGAWHGPALVELDATAKSDAKILKALPKSKIKVACTWIPWTNSRLSIASGYGAGIYSPGWYEHQWNITDQTEIRWLAKVAATFREKQMDISTAHVIETYRLARSLAVLRNKPFIALDELNEATLSVMCMGDGILLNLVREQLIVGNSMGHVPDDIPKVPLQEDFEQHIKSLRLKLTAVPKTYDLDLRKEGDLERSVFFHRLEIIELPWLSRTASRTKGTFKESWTAEWKPELMIVLIDKAFLGNTIEAAAETLVRKQGTETDKITELARLIQLSIPAQLYQNLDHLLFRINELTSISADIVDLMNAIPRLVDISRYGDVRRSDLSVLNTVVQQLLTKVFVGLPNACYGLDEANSQNMFGLITRVNTGVRLYDNVDTEQQWYDTLHRLLDKHGVNHIILGCVCRLLLDAQQLSEEETERRISFALSSANDPFEVAAWLEGFLGSNGMILLYDNRLWNLMYSWVESLPDDTFTQILALLRRSFSKFEYGERRQIGVRARKGRAVETHQSLTEREGFDAERAAQILPVLKELLGGVE
ncbi:DUF5682 family protein [Chryseolinea lacunae]|uniref:Uncharacterized protein n=1 Tax=Chryseolinea lacunae TaxID=2801331 RepID=A0ABS1KWV9_9BACT|nr:DUF5682 family protein [Chryseolinea lacunae]MBL0743683.1 hypothetical protein [Chryseolinea lacunae]